MRERYLDPHDAYNPDNVIVSPYPEELVRRSIDFPWDLSGLRILDIGSGASDTVKFLRKKGAVVFGVDMGYSDIRALAEKADYFSRDPWYWVRGGRVGDKIFPLNEPFDERATNIESFLREQRTLIDFLRDVRDPENTSYVAGDAQLLPFADESIDFAFSHYALSIFQLGDLDVFKRSVSETLRVLRPGGELQLTDWPGHILKLWTKKQRKNSRAFLRSLHRQRIPFSVEHTHRHYVRLRIRKP